MKPTFKCDGEVCRISGATTFSYLDTLSDDLLTRAGRQEDISLDLKLVSDCDSAFIALLMACLQIKKQQNHTLSLYGCPDKVLAMIDVYGLAGSGLQIDK